MVIFKLFALILLSCASLWECMNRATDKDAIAAVGFGLLCYYAVKHMLETALEYRVRNPEVFREHEKRKMMGKRTSWPCPECKGPDDPGVDCPNIEKLSCSECGKTKGLPACLIHSKCRKCGGTLHNFCGLE